MYFAPNSILIIVYFFEDFSSMLQPHPALTRKIKLAQILSVTLKLVRLVVYGNG